MNNKKLVGLLLNVDKLKEAESLSPKEFKQLIVALRMYQEGEDVQENTLSSACKIVYRIMRLDVARNMESWNEKCKQNRLNGQKGGAPRGNQNAAKKNKEQNQSKPIFSFPSETFQQIVDWYHEYCPSFPPIIRLTDARKLKIQACLKDMIESNYTIDCFRDVFMAMERSEFLKKTQGIDLDWLIKNTDNWYKVYEGKYNKLYDTPKQDEKTSDKQEDDPCGDTEPAQYPEIDETASSTAPNFGYQASQFGSDPSQFTPNYSQNEVVEYIKNAPSFPGTER